MFDKWKFKEYPELTHYGHPEDFEKHIDEWFRVYTHNMSAMLRRVVLLGAVSFTGAMAILIAILHWGFPSLQILLFGR